MAPDLAGSYTKRLAPLDSSERMALKKRHLPDGSLFPGRTAVIALISESGLYKLVMRSDKPEAKRFQDWVTKDALPAIRKDGGYITRLDKFLRQVGLWVLIERGIFKFQETPDTPRR